MTAFGGDILVAPNIIDFQRVQQAFDNVDPDDLLVLITLCSTFLLYVLVLVKARMADKVDASKVGVKSKYSKRILSNDDAIRCLFEIRKKILIILK